MDSRPGYGRDLRVNSPCNLCAVGQQAENCRRRRLETHEAVRISTPLCEFRSESDFNDAHRVGRVAANRESEPLAELDHRKVFHADVANDPL